jgi:hypothetical protein
VLGVNCLLVSKQGTQEPIGHIADYSSALGTAEGCWDQAEAHIAARRGTPFVYEVVLYDDLDRAV